MWPRVGLALVSRSPLHLPETRGSLPGGRYNQTEKRVRGWVPAELAKNGLWRLPLFAKAEFGRERTSCAAKPQATRQLLVWVRARPASPHAGAVLESAHWVPGVASRLTDRCRVEPRRRRPPRQPLLSSPAPAPLRLLGARCGARLCQSAGIPPLCSHAGVSERAASAPGPHVHPRNLTQQSPSPSARQGHQHQWQRSGRGRNQDGGSTRCTKRSAATAALNPPPPLPLSRQPPFLLAARAAAAVAAAALAWCSLHREILSVQPFLAGVTCAPVCNLSAAARPRPLPPGLPHYYPPPPFLRVPACSCCSGNARDGGC